jgi:uncharacterized membrane protein YraQ (UPF0718 family)
MHGTIPQRKRHKGGLPIAFLFLGSLLLIYIVLILLVPAKAIMALKSSGRICLNVLGPLAFVFLILWSMNLFIKPQQVVRFFGQEAGTKGVILAAMAGILSMGPIYAWYPLLKELKQKGAEGSLLAVFLGNRAVKPFLLPILISYFGLIYVLVLTSLMVCGSLAVGYIVRALARIDEGNFFNGAGNRFKITDG